MSELQFEENNYTSRPRYALAEQKTPKMIAFLIRNKIVKDKVSANRLLLVLAIILFCISILITVYYNSGYGIPDDSKAKAEAWQNYLKTAPKLPSNE